MNIQLVKFTTGEETVFEVVEKYGDVIEVKNGLTMVFDGQSLRAIPFTVNCDEGTVLKLNVKDIIFITDPRKDLAEQYKSQFSAIIQPPKGIVTQL